MISEKLCETESVSTGVLQHGQINIVEFLWKTSLSSMGETNMHLTNTFNDELTSYLKQYTLCNAIDNFISLLHSHRIHKRAIFCKLQMFCIFYISCGCTPEVLSITGTLTNSKDLDEMAHNAIFHQGLHSLQ